MRRFEETVGSQFARPRGLLGQFAARFMRRGNAQLNLWMVDLLEVKPQDRVLEVGFGPGVALPLLIPLANLWSSRGRD